MYSRKKNEMRTLEAIGSTPIDKATTKPTWPAGAPEIQLRVWMRTRQTFVYHVCDTIAQGGWAAVQNTLNEMQRELENLYESSTVELVNVYRKTQTKTDGICIIAIYKIGPLLPAAADPGQSPRSWRERFVGLFDP
jgi:hypothetical protein